MSQVDFKLLQNKINGKWMISAPRRSHRTNIEKPSSVCPFCPGDEVPEEEVYRVQNTQKTQQSGISDRQIVRPSDESVAPGSPSFPKDKNWKVRVVKNKYPFAENHEVIIHSPDHHKNWDELPFSQVENIVRTYRQRFIAHKKDGAGLPAGRQVYLFHNRGHAGGESLPHPHTQLVVIPQNVKMDIMPLDQGIYSISENSEHSVNRMVRQPNNQKVRSTEEPSIPSIPSIPEILETEHFFIFCPATSEWPDEVWIAPKQNGGGFGFIKDTEVTDLAFVLTRLVQIYNLRHGHEFPFNFYIPPLKNWYLRLIPRKKIIGGFELGTNIIVNTQDPAETFAFISEHFWKPDTDKIKTHHQAEYGNKV